MRKAQSVVKTKKELSERWNAAVTAMKEFNRELERTAPPTLSVERGALAPAKVQDFEENGPIYTEMERTHGDGGKSRRQEAPIGVTRWAWTPDPSGQEILMRRERATLRVTSVDRLKLVEVESKKGSRFELHVMSNKIGRAKKSRGKFWTDLRGDEIAGLIAAGVVCERAGGKVKAAKGVTSWAGGWELAEYEISTYDGAVKVQGRTLRVNGEVCSLGIHGPDLNSYELGSPSAAIPRDGCVVTHLPTGLKVAPPGSARYARELVLALIEGCPELAIEKRTKEELTAEVRKKANDIVTRIVKKYE